MLLWPYSKLHSRVKLTLITRGLWLLGHSRSPISQTAAFLNISYGYMVWDFCSINCLECTTQHAHEHTHTRTYTNVHTTHILFHHLQGIHCRVQKCSLLIPFFVSIVFSFLQRIDLHK